MLLRHCERRAASRADCTAGRSSAARMAIIAITTRSSISVKPPGYLDAGKFFDRGFWPAGRLRQPFIRKSPAKWGKRGTRGLRHETTSAREALSTRLALLLT